MRRDCAALLLVLLFLAFCGLALAGAAGKPDGYQLLANPGLEDYAPPYGQWHGVACQVASAWQRRPSGEPGPCWLDTRVFAESPLGSGWVERMEGDTSQMIAGTEPYTATLLQKVSGLTPGQGYGFHAALLTIYQSAAQPRLDGTMIKRVGLDPSGGSDPAAPGVVWSEPDGRDKKWEIQLRTAAFAASSSVTVFVQVASLYPAGPWPFMNQGFVDSAILARTPAVEAVSPGASCRPEWTVSWDNVAMPPGGGQFQGVDVQWLDEGEGTWHDWLTQTLAVEASFLGQPEHSYRFRARAWASYPNGAWLHGPYRAEGDTATVVMPSGLAGRVLGHDGLPLLGATVALSGTAYSSSSGPGGLYELCTPALGGAQAAAVHRAGWLSPAPALALYLPPTATLPLSWTLRPPDDAVANGGFEGGLAPWSVSSGGGPAPMAAPEGAHTGQAGLALGGEWPAAYTAALSQTVTLLGAWQPALSLWLRPLSGGGDDALVVRAELAAGQPGSVALTSGLTLTPALSAREWQHVWAPIGPPQAYLTGTVTVELLLHEDGEAPAAAVYVDEVVLGSSRGGPHRAYLPLVGR